MVPVAQLERLFGAAVHDEVDVFGGGLLLRLFWMQHQYYTWWISYGETLLQLSVITSTAVSKVRDISSRSVNHSKPLSGLLAISYPPSQASK